MSINGRHLRIVTPDERLPATGRGEAEILRDLVRHMAAAEEAIREWKQWALRAVDQAS